MEQFPHQQKTAAEGHLDAAIETGAEWRSLREQAPVHAQELIDQRASEFATLPTSERAELLQDILDTLCQTETGTCIPLDNTNRFLAKELANRLAAEERRLTEEERIAKKGFAAWYPPHISA